MVALVLLALVGVGGYYGAKWWFENQWNRVPTLAGDTLLTEDGEDALVEAGPEEPVTFLIVGSDSREVLSEDIRGEYDARSEANRIEGQRADVLMLVHLNPNGDEPSYVLSFPRDLQVRVPGLGRERINAAYHEGPGRVVETVRDLTGIEINHYAEFNFESFRGIVDEVGGVPICIAGEAARDAGSGLAIDESMFTKVNEDGLNCYELDGRNALAWVRSRKYQEKVDGVWQSDGSGDLGRITRQRTFILALLARVAGNPKSVLKINDYAEVAEDYVTVDEGLDFDTAKALFENFVPFDDERVKFLELPVYDIDGNRLALGKGSEELFELLRGEIDQSHENYERLLRGELPEDPEGIPPPEVDRSTFTVTTLNAKGEPGLAGATEAYLVGLGWQSAGVGDAAPTPRSRPTRILYDDDGARNAALRLAADLGFGQPIPGETQGADLLLVLGEDALDGDELTSGTTTTRPGLSEFESTADEED